jgi:lactoylglutathione lyase
MESITEFRIALTVDNFDKCLSFYRDALGLSVIQAWPSAEGRGVLLSLSKATLEIIDQKHATWVDQMEVGHRVSGPVRFAFQSSDLHSIVRAAEAAGAQLINSPVETPWKDLNARLIGPDGMQMTLFSTPHKST